MRSARHIVEWHGEYYTVEPLKSLSRVTSLSPTWAVSRRGEFIGTLPYRLNETPEELAARCRIWLQELLEVAPPWVRR
jgi:hypothetical protein